MPVLPKDNVDGVRTRGQRQQEVHERRFGDSPVQEDQQSRQPIQMESAAPESIGASSSSSVGQAPVTGDLAAIMAMLCRQEEQARLQEEQRRQEKEEQRRHQEEQRRWQEEQRRQQEEQRRQDKEEQARLMKELFGSIGKEFQEVKEQIEHHESRMSEVEIQIAKIKKALDALSSGDSNVAPTIGTPSARDFKMPPYDGSSSWSAYKIQFEAVVKANGWTTVQAMTALTLGLRDKALTVLEALGKDFTYEQLLEALESRYGDAHLEHVFRAQLKDRSQRNSENLQQWALEIEKLVRKAYQTSPAPLDSYLVQAFVDGIRDLEVRAAVRLGHPDSLKNALAHALEVEAVRQDHRAHRIREVKDSYTHDSRPKFSPRCCGCGERRHLRSSCPKKVEAVRQDHRAHHIREVKDSYTGYNRPKFSPRCYGCGEKGHLKSNCPKREESMDELSRRPCPENWKHCAEEKPKEAVPVRLLRSLRTDLSDEWKETLQQAQQDDKDLKPIIERITAGSTKPLWSDIAALSSTTKSYWAQWESLVIHDGVLCRKWENARGDHCHLQMVVPKAKVPNVLQLYHEGCSGGHMGVKRTLLKIRERFYWIHCREDVEDWCRKCTTCAAVKGPHTRSRGALKLYNVGAPWERIALDIAGPFPVSKNGNKYFMVVMDYFTKWPEVFAIPNQEASTVADKLVHEVFCRFGVPLEIHSDQGRNFESQVFQETCRIMGTHKTRTTSYHPQSDGMVERFNQTLERYLAKVVENKQNDWDQHIQPFLLSYRSAVHESTGATPALANFGRELRLPADLITGIPPDSPRAITDYANDLRNKMNDINEHIRLTGQQMSEKMKTRYDRNSNNLRFDEGSQVWLHNPIRKKGKSPKLQAKWDGPYRVLTRINDVTYRIQKGTRGAPKIVHVDRLARYYGANNARDEHVLGGGSVTPRLLNNEW